MRVTDDSEDWAEMRARVMPADFRRAQLAVDSPTVEAVNEPPAAQIRQLTFDELRQSMARTERTAAWRDAGKWALDRLEAILGPSWPPAVERHAPDGHSDQLRLSPSHVVAYTELLELALRLDLLATVPGFAKVRRAITKDPRPAQLAHAQIQLEVAALAMREGHDPRLEPGHRKAPTDVALATPAGELTVETRAVLTSVHWRDAHRRTDLLFERIRAVERAHGVRCEGELTEQLSLPQEDELIAALEDRARLVELELSPPPLHIAGASLHVVPESRQPAGGLHGPQIRGDSWARIGPRIVDKAQKAAESGANWLRLDVREGLFQFTAWAQMRLAQKLEALTPLIQPSLQQLDGIVLSSGALLAQGQFEPETATLLNSGWACRRLIAPLRVRETFIIAAAATTAESASASWQQLYHAEPAWLSWALRRVGLPAPEEIFSY